MKRLSTGYQNLIPTIHQSLLTDHKWYQELRTDSVFKLQRIVTHLRLRQNVVRRFSEWQTYTWNPWPFPGFLFWDVLKSRKKDTTRGRYLELWKFDVRQKEGYSFNDERWNWDEETLCECVHRGPILTTFTWVEYTNRRELLVSEQKVTTSEFYEQNIHNW